MKPNKRLRLAEALTIALLFRKIGHYLFVSIAAAIVLYAGPYARAQGESDGTVTGRVFNQSSGQYLQLARISVVGTTIETFTDELGYYRLTNVPAREVTLSAFYTGLDPQTTTVRVAAGGTAQQDFTLAHKQMAASNIVALDPYIVASSREYNARAIALNEQRFAPNIKNVVSTDEFGEIGESNLGEFIKFIPGVSVGYSGGVMATNVSIRGLPPVSTLLTMDGGEVASADVATNRQAALHSFPILNNIARVEVAKTPTPDKPANMMGGSLNLISRSAFEQKKARLSYNLAGTWNSKTSGLKYPGVGDKEVSTIGPAVNLNYIKPVNDRFGFSLSGSYFSRLNIHNMSTTIWDQIAEKLIQFTVDNSPQIRASASAGAGADYKVSDRGILSGRITYSEYNVDSDQYTNIAQLQANPRGDQTFAESNGAVGRGILRSGHTPILDQTWHGSVRYRHHGPAWKFDANSYYSSSTNRRRALDHGSLTNVEGQLFNVYVRMDDLTTRGPASIISRDAAGNPVELFDVTKYRLVSAQDFRRNAWTYKKGGTLDLGRRLDFQVPVDVKVGTYYSRVMKDSRSETKAYTFVGPDKVANNADNGVALYDWVARDQSSLPGSYGTADASYLSAYKVTDYFRAHPDEFTSNPVAEHTDRVNNSHQISETITAAYFRGDARLLNNRLWVIGGVRFEDTEDKGVGTLNDLRATFVQDSNGNLVRDSQGRTIRVTTDPLRLAQLQFKERGAHAERSYDGFFPSLNLAFNLTDNLILRAAYARTLGRPNFNTIKPGVSITDPDVANPRITVANTGLKPWTAHGYDLMLEWYFGAGSLASVGVFQKDAADFFGALVTPATTELLESFGLSDDYLGYELSTQSNVGDARIRGLEFSYRQDLSFLPPWARGLQIFANGTFLDLAGSSLADFTGYSERDLSWGVSLSRTRYAVKLNWSANGETRGNLVAASAAIPPDTYLTTPRRTTLDASFEYRLSPRISIYGTARNLFDRRVNRLRAGVNSPGFTQPERYNEPGIFCTFGVKGDF